MTSDRGVLHVIPSVAARYGGPSTAIVGMCRALARAGMPTTIATTDADGEGRLPVVLGEPVEHEGVPAIFFPRTASEAFKWSPRLSSWLADHVGDYDLVHVHAVFSHSSLAASRACRAAAVPYVLRPLGTLDPWSLAQKPFRKRALLRLGGDRMLAGAAAMHYTSIGEQQLAEGALPRLPGGIVVPLGVDDEWFGSDDAPQVHHGDPYVLSMSRIDGKKGLDLLVRAFHSAASGALGHWRLVIAGDGERDTRAALEKLAWEGSAATRITFAGWVDGSRKYALVRGAAVLALPSAQENFGIAVAEAMAAGKPVLVTPGVNLAADIVGAQAGWVVEREASAIAAGLREAMADADTRAVKGRAAREFAERFRWASVATALEEMYVRICERRTPNVRRRTSTLHEKQAATFAPRGRVS